ncbi:5'-AMP-activated protein kinase subunit gamma-2 [Homalodisca vitripennis]|nr:5'-AMP-activated protein kinase subunit gamma-2 [Homalodisca vitripennis]KAG8314060.1 5'-AMP-activated protein kinase subunit gamma-2 [Homalodisca vitripennis]
MSGDGEGEKTPPPADEDEEDDDFDDLRDQINYNTITSLAALKEILGHDSRTSSDDVSWFQHYFLHHVNRLPSRSQYPGRRLSECPEEDESAAAAESATSATETAATAAEDDSSSSETSSSSSTSSDDEEEEEEEESKAESKESKAESSPTSSAPPTPKRNPSLTPDTPPLSPRTLSRGTSPHFDKRFFDSSIIEMKSQASSTSTLDNDSTEEIWVRRIDADTARRKRFATGKASDQPLIYGGNVQAERFHVVLGPTMRSSLLVMWSGGGSHELSL